MKTQLKLVSVFILMIISTSFYAQENFKMADLAFLENVALNLKSQSVKNFMEEKGFSYKEKIDDVSGVAQYVFENKERRKTVIVGFTPSDKLYCVQIISPLTIENALIELELKQFHRFEIAAEDDTYTEWKKENYPFRFLVVNDIEDSRIITLVTKDYSFNKPRKDERLVTVDRLKEVLGLSNKSVQQVLLKKKYFQDKSNDSEEKGGSGEEIFSDVEFKTGIVVNYKNEKSFIVGVFNITEDEYNNMLKWLKANKSKKKESESGQDSWDILNGDYTVVLTHKNEPIFKPEGIYLRKNN